MTRYRAHFFFALILALAGITGSEGLATPEGGFVCPPCGCDRDGQTFDTAGHCPSCAMRLVRRVKTVAIVMFEGVQIIDFAGPYEVFGQAGFKVITVSDDGAPLTTAMNLRVDPTHSIDDSPVPDILLVPGGGVDAARGNPRLMRWIEKMAGRAEHVLSVCNGAFILADAGLLDGKSATTFYALLETLAREAKKTTVHWDKRFVDNGRIVTSAGLSSGIDAALHVVGKVMGPVRAKGIALHLEYDWDPRSQYARGALADMNIPQLRPPKGVVAELIETTGDRSQWTRTYRIRTPTPAKTGAIIERQLTAAGWVQQAGGQWTFSDREGHPWRAKVETAPIDRGLRYRVHVERR